MPTTTYRNIRDSLTHLHLDAPCPWLVSPDYVGIFDFSGGKDSTLFASLIFEAPASSEQLSVLAEQRDKHVTVLCTDTRMGIPDTAKEIPGKPPIGVDTAMKRSIIGDVEYRRLWNANRSEMGQ